MQQGSGLSLAILPLLLGNISLPFLRRHWLWNNQKPISWYRNFDPVVVKQTSNNPERLPVAFMRFGPDDKQDKFENGTFSLSLAFGNQMNFKCDTLDDGRFCCFTARAALRISRCAGLEP